MECTAELKKEFEAKDLIPYTAFIELLPVFRQAHIDRDIDRLKMIYDFAEWCHRQKDEKSVNAVGVSFYEHLADFEETYLQFTYWIKKDIYLDFRDLLNQRADDEKMKRLDEYYQYKPIKRNHDR